MKAHLFLFWLADRTFATFLLMRILPVGDGAGAGENLAEFLREVAALGRWIWPCHPGRRVKRGKGRRRTRRQAVTA